MGRPREPRRALRRHRADRPDRPRGAEEADVAASTAQLAELERIGPWRGTYRLPIREHFGIGSFGINAYEAAEAGVQVIEQHHELGPGAGGHEELYLVVAGHATFTVDGDEIDAPAGTVVFVSDPRSKRAATAREQGTTVVVAGGVAGRAFEASTWEQGSRVIELFDRGDYEGARAFMLDVLARHPEEGVFLYNLACAESRLGLHDEAIEHVRAAVERAPRLLDTARDDEDLAAIRGDPRFPAAPVTTTNGR